MTSSHPVIKRVADFSIRDEHYAIGLTDPTVDVFCKTYSVSGQEQIADYSKQIGQGKLCVLTPGHILSVWHHPQFQTMLRGALHYLAPSTG